MYHRHNLNVNASRRVHIILSSCLCYEHSDQLFISEIQFSGNNPICNFTGKMKDIPMYNPYTSGSAHDVTSFGYRMSTGHEKREYLIRVWASASPVAFHDRQKVFVGRNTHTGKRHYYSQTTSSLMPSAPQSVLRTYSIAFPGDVLRTLSSHLDNYSSRLSSVPIIW